MINILIPLGGKGERFSKNGYTFPKPLIKVLGKEIICWVIDHLDLTFVNKIFIPYHLSLEYYRFGDFLSSKYTNIEFEFLCLDNETKGSSESIYYIMKNVSSDDKKLPILCLDGDNFYLYNIIESYYKSNNKNIVFSILDESNQDCFSFLKINGKNQIFEIKEKERISDQICTGCYGFESGFLLEQASKKMIEESLYHQRGESYTSGMIQMLIDQGNIFEMIEIPKDFWICLGTPFHIKMFCNNITVHQAIKSPVELNIPKYRFCFDLDNTLVTSPTIQGDYTTVNPIERTISMVRYLKQLGHTIIIYTARRMKTHNGNVSKVIQDIGKITFETMENFEIPFDELIFGKPYANFYIDDLGVNAFTNLEKELGFYESKITPRDFHQVNFLFDSIIKRGIDLSSEIYWYQNSHSTIKDIFPLLLKFDSENKWYEMERIHGFPISKIYLDQELTNETLSSILVTIERIHNSFDKIDNDVNEELNIYGNYSSKLKSRYKEELYNQFENHKKIFDLIIQKLDQYEILNLGIKKVIHGDPVFTNIFINSFGKIKMIDVRGKILDKNSLFGDCFYDYAKLYQSLIGYDEILLDKRIDNKYKNQKLEYFEKYIENKFGNERMEWIKIITASLLFSLIPLHSDLNKNQKYFGLINNIIHF
jgi:capsule biosynthesis phosphatase